MQNRQPGTGWRQTNGASLFAAQIRSDTHGYVVLDVVVEKAVVLVVETRVAKNVGVGVEGAICVGLHGKLQVSRLIIN